MLLYAVTIFLSAFLLFQVQPLIAKIILPWFGGSAAVWSAALMFFQISLLAGYTYAHVLARYFKPRRQMLIHGGLLLVSLLSLPILPSPEWRPTEANDPTLRIVLLLAATIGLPYFLLSSTSPLLQVWYVRKTGSAVPYRLFALSNFGSMLALLSFPFLVEPTMASTTQAYTWTGIYVAFAALCIYAAWVSRMEAPTPPVEEAVDALAAAAHAQHPVTNADMGDALDPAQTTISAARAVAAGDVAVEELRANLAAESQRPSLGDKVLWVGLAACASALLVSITNHLSANVAPIPLLWVVPLALYLLSFILSFESDRTYQRWLFIPWTVPALGWMAYAIYAEDGNYHISKAIPIFCIGLFLCCMMCHGELSLRKPAPRYLTSFFLMVSLGGALGGVFVALIAPNLFVTFLELPIALVATGIFGMISLWNIELPKWGPTPLRLLMAVGVGLLGGYLIRLEMADREGYLFLQRNFYGALRGLDSDVGTEFAERSLLHGTINHGAQRLAPGFKQEVNSYYAPTSGVGRAMRVLQDRGPVRYGVIGLGAGVMSGYARAEDYVRIYEINPAVPDIAQTYFTFFPDSEADKDILLGDARLTLEQQPAQDFDLLVVDAFSSDAIPVHLLTNEVMDLYDRHLRPGGILAVHISNRYLDLAPVCLRAAESVNKQAMVIYDEGYDPQTGISNQFAQSTTWVLISSDPNFFQEPLIQAGQPYPPNDLEGFEGWTDNYSSLWPIIDLELPD